MTRLRTLLDAFDAFTTPHTGRHTRAALRRSRRSQGPAEPFGPELRIGHPPVLTATSPTVAHPADTAPFPIYNYSVKEHPSWT